MLNTENIQPLIDSGEGYNVEFKVRVPSKVRELTEEICAFANADGGYLLIGVDNNGQVIDINLENDKVYYVRYRGTKKIKGKLRKTNWSDTFVIEN